MEIHLNGSILGKEISIHNKEQLTKAENMAYLQDALKGRPAEQVISGLAQTVDAYKESISCLQSCYDQRCLIHQAHVRTILEAALLKSGGGKEVRRLHDITNQHSCPLKVVKQDSFNSLLRAIIKSKIDSSTMKEWQKYSRDQKAPPYQEILKNVLIFRHEIHKTSYMTTYENGQL